MVAPRSTADLRVGQPVAGQLHDLSLLRGQLAEGLRAIAGPLPGGRQLSSGPLGERLRAHRLQQMVGGAQQSPGGEDWPVALRTGGCEVARLVRKSDVMAGFESR